MQRLGFGPPGEHLALCTPHVRLRGAVVVLFEQGLLLRQGQRLDESGPLTQVLRDLLLHAFVEQLVQHVPERHLQHDHGVVDAERALHLEGGDPLHVETVIRGNLADVDVPHYPASDQSDVEETDLMFEA